MSFGFGFLIGARAMVAMRTEARGRRPDTRQVGSARPDLNGGTAAA